jgi:S1-C subfamily serine protease
MPKSSRSNSTFHHPIIAALLFVWATFIAFYAPDIAAFHARHVADHAQNSVVRLVLHLLDGREGVCTGVVIQKGLILTAAHCADSEEGILAINADDAPTEIVAVDDSYDLAVLSSPAAERRPVLELGSGALMRGDHLTAIGYAGGGEFLVQMNGLLMLQAARVDEGLAPCIIANYIGIPGMSGGPVIDASGRLVSIVSRGITGVSCGMNTEILRVFLYNALR